MTDQQIKLVKVKIDPDRFTLDDLIIIEEAGSGLSNRSLRTLIARFMTDEQGQYLEGDAAEKAAGGLSISESMQVITALGEKIEEAKRKAVPPTNGGG